MQSKFVALQSSDYIDNVFVTLSSTTPDKTICMMIILMCLKNIIIIT